jgi:threonylcarbamoyladenosine tRNA methylthiotransferase MtaB
MSAELVTFGCRLNTNESEVMRGHAQRAGLDDAVIVNTCAVTGEAVRQARQTIRRIRRENPEKKIIVTGCAAQTDADSFAAMPEVDRVVGNIEKLDPGTWTRIHSAGRKSVTNIMAVRQTAMVPIEGIEGRARAIVQVQNGCDHRCTFCVIPFGRGNSRSVPADDVVAQVRTLAANGYREIVLTGVDITSYGEHLPDAPKLGALVKRVLKEVPEIERLRLSSIDSVEADADLLDAFGDEPRLMPHLHLSLQAGDDLVLKRMKRRHSRADAIAFCQKVKRLRPDIVFGADIIAGFPTEDEAMFARSLDLVAECELTHLHVFPFSPRPGTSAARMPQVARPIVKERAARLREKGDAALRRHLQAQVGKTLRVLTEYAPIGHTEQFTAVRFASAPIPGRIIDVHIAGHDGRRLIAA